MVLWEDKQKRKQNFSQTHQGKKERIKINKIRNEKGDVTTDTTEIQRMLRDCYRLLYANKMDNLEEIDKFVERCNFPILNQEELENMNRPIPSNKIETMIKNLPRFSKKQKSRMRWCHRQILSNIEKS